MKLVVLALAGAASFASIAPASAAVFTNLNNTGVANAWTYAIGTSTNGTIAYGSAATAQTVTNPVWFSNTQTSSWIAPDSSGSNNPGYYLYSTTFNVSNLGAGDSLRYNFAGDDAVMRVLLNGNLLYTGNTANVDYNSFRTGSTSSGLANGQNVLQFEIYNQGSNANPTGFRAELAGVSAVPEPVGWATMIAGFGLLGPPCGVVVRRLPTSSDYTLGGVADP